MNAAQTLTRADVNRANALFSTGPKSPEGRAKSSLNAVKSGLTGRTVLLHSDDAAEYQEYIRGWQEEFQPVGQRESELVQSISDTCWRLRRVPGLEMAIYAQGRLEFANSFDQHDPALRSHMIELKTMLAYDKQLRNLQLQESRLARRREKEMAELRALQKERKEKQAQALAAAAKQKSAPLNASERTGRLVPVVRDSNESGFEFSSATPASNSARFGPISEAMGAVSESRESVKPRAAAVVQP